MKTTAAVAAAGVAFAAAVALSSRPPSAAAPGSAVLPNAKLISAFGRSNLSMLADLYWIRVCGSAVDVRTPAQGKDFLDWTGFVTDLDAKFYWAYVMGAVVGVVEARTGDGGLPRYANADRAEALLTKGLAVLPRHELSIFLAYNQLQLQGHLEDAARTLRAGARLQGAPKYMGMLATRILASIGQFQAATEFAESMAQLGDEDTREVFKARLQELRDQEYLQRARDANAALGARLGRRPTVAELRAQLAAERTVPPEVLGRLEFAADGTVAIEGVSRMRIFRREDAAAQESTSP